MIVGNRANSERGRLDLVAERGSGLHDLGSSSKPRILFQVGEQESSNAPESGKCSQFVRSILRDLEAKPNIN